MKKERKKYSPAEKAELSIAQISSKYGVHSTQINQWKRQLLNTLPDTFSNKQKQILTDHESELS